MLKRALTFFFPIQTCSVWRFLAHMQALAPHTRRRVQTNNCFHPEIKAAPFLWDCGESLCFPLRVFIYPSANNGHLAGEFFRESILPLSPSLNLLAELFSARRYPLERSPAENYLLSPPPPPSLLLYASNILTQQSEVWTPCDRIHKVPILGGGDRCECLRRVGGQRQQPAVCVI